MGVTNTTEQERAQALAEKHGATSYRNRADTQNPAYGFTPIQLAALIAEVEQAARRAPAVPETIEQRAKKLKGLQVLTGATAGVPEAIALARSRFVEAYGRSPLHDDLAYACLLIDAYGGAPAAPVPQGWKLVPVEPTSEMCSKGAVQIRWSAIEQLAAKCYNAMLAAAPQPPEAAQSNSAEFDGIKTKAAAVQLPEPDSYCFQHEETGLTEYVDAQQVEWGFEKNNPRWKRVGAAYSEQQVRLLLAAHGIKEQST